MCIRDRASDPRVQPRVADPWIRQTRGDRDGRASEAPFARVPGDRVRLTNDEAGDAQLIAELKRAEYDGVAIGGYINGQDAVNFPATEETTFWFNRILNIVHANAPRAKIILVRGPEDVVPAIERVLGEGGSSWSP